LTSKKLAFGTTNWEHFSLSASLEIFGHAIYEIEDNTLAFAIKFSKIIEQPQLVTTKNRLRRRGALWRHQGAEIRI